MNRYSVIESKVWKHKDGRTASIYGACPWYSETDRNNWTILVRGWTIKDNKTNEIGRVCREPMTLVEAQDRCEVLNFQYNSLPRRLGQELNS